MYCVYFEMSDVIYFHKLNTFECQGHVKSCLSSHEHIAQFFLEKKEFNIPLFPTINFI